MTTSAKPARRPVNRNFSSGPCAKRPGWSPKALDNAFLGRSHRAKEGKARLKRAIEETKALLGLPAGYVCAIVPASDTGAFEMAMWSMLVAIYSIAGDLEESRLKREAGVKDSGRILPGHGGLLDRLDGQLAAMPIWFLALAQMHLLVAS